MKIFIITKNGQPEHVTFCAREADEQFDQAVEDGDTGTTSLMAVATSFSNTGILRREKHAV